MIDLQSHSTVSDGQLEPADVVRAAAEAGITVMALTDHDGVAGVPEANRVAAELGIENVPAIEMSCVHKYSEDLHICGYWVDLEKIQPACDRAQQERVDRAKSIIAKLNEHGVEVSFEEAVAKAGAADAIGRPHIAKAAGAGPDLGPFFEEYLVPGAKAFVSRTWPSAEQAVQLIHDAGGVAVVAHPYWDVKDPEQVRDLVESLARDVGLDGIETFYPPHTEEQTKHCLELCEEFGLVPTASSDFHGPTHKTFSVWGDYDTYGLGEPQVPPKPSPRPAATPARLRSPRPPRRARYFSCFRRRPGSAIGARARISARIRAESSPGSSDGSACPPAGSKNSTLILGRFGKRTMSTVPAVLTQTSFASGTARARRPMPLRARSVRPREIVPSGKTPMQAPSRSCCVAASSAPASAAPRLIGICPIPFRIGASGLMSQRLALASARICRRGRPAIPIATGSQWLSWLPMSRTGPDWGRCSSPATSRRPQVRTSGEQAAMAKR